VSPTALTQPPAAAEEKGRPVMHPGTAQHSSRSSRGGRLRPKMSWHSLNSLQQLREKEAKDLGTVPPQHSLRSS
jgi:hypothetical protein